MKALNELIEVMDHVEFNCTNCKLQYDCDETECFLENAVYYLKKYRDEDKQLGRAINEACEVEMEYYRLIEDFKKNEPLSWDELKQMNGKPVWLEGNSSFTNFIGWCIISNVLSDRVHIVLSHYDNNFLTNEMILPKITFGSKWNMYKKERTEDERNKKG